MADWRLISGGAIAVLLLVALFGGPSRGGTTLSTDGIAHSAECRILWGMRNEIYQEQGYCFRTPRGRAIFNNAGCEYNRVKQVPLTFAERKAVARIRQIETEKGCLR